MILILLFVVGLALTVGPWLVPTLDIAAKGTISGVGVATLILVAFAAIITKLYVKASANLAFVRTGMGGAKVVKDAGRIVFPVVHQVIPVSLETMRLNVERRGPHALITRDNLRVDLSAEFYINVQANDEDILQAARSLGGRSVQAGSVSELVQEKLVSALRTVAATKDLVELHSKRDEFASSVHSIVTHDLASNGLTLESVTISALDQTDTSALQERNVFDAQGLRKIAEITQRALVDRNEIVRAAERARKKEDVGTRKQILELERDEAEFEAQQKATVANVQAEREREVREFRLQQDEAVARREIAKQQAVETAEVDRTRAVESAEVDKRIALVNRFREQETAEIEKTKAVELAERLKAIAIAQKEEERAAALAKALTADAERESAEQRVVTVEVEAIATREASKKLIAARQVIDEERIRRETEADVAAYQETRAATAEKDAAEMRYEAQLRLAQADAEAERKRAEGDEARKLVDVNIERERVAVERERVAVERQSLQNKSEFEAAALQFELERQRIDADRDVRIRTAEALGQMLAKANMQIFGDPTTMSQMSRGFMDAAGVGNRIDGFLKNLPIEARDMLEAFASKYATNGHHGNGNGAVNGPTASAAGTDGEGGSPGTSASPGTTTAPAPPKGKKG